MYSKELIDIDAECEGTALKHARDWNTLKKQNKLRFTKSKHVNITWEEAIKRSEE